MSKGELVDYVAAEAGLTKTDAAKAVDAMMKGIEKGLVQGIAQGSENTLLENIKNIMEGLSMPLEKALELLKVPKSDYAQYEELLK